LHFCGYCSRFYASGVLTPLGDGGSLGFVKVLRDLTDRKRMEDSLREARDELEARVAERTAELTQANEARAELLRRLVRAQEDERRRVSRELHDGLGQELMALILSLKALELAIPEGSPGRDHLRDVEVSVGRIGREAHDLAVELRPTALDDIGLGAALADYVARWSERTGVVADFQGSGLGADRLPPEVESTVYRVVQEALNNTAKHAAARHVSVIVERRAGELTALVEDDGRGFDPGRAGAGRDRRRLGMLGMRERIALIGGTLLIESSEGDGTTVRARISLHQSSGEAGNGD
jgi:signal transduction histidine kinase